jgi:hypothetical protein
VSYLKTFGKFWYDFIIGDDWRLALGVAAAIIVMTVAVHQGFDWWWLLPVVVVVLLGVSVSQASSPKKGTHVAGEEH